jgi:hypothetical protein
LGKPPKNSCPNQVDVARRGPDNRSPAIGSQLDLRCPPILRREVELDQTTAFHPLGVMGQPAPLPADLGCQGAHLHAVVGHSAQGVEGRRNRQAIGHCQIGVGGSSRTPVAAEPA